MGSVLPKAKLYLFLSVVSLLISLSVFTVALIDTPRSNSEDFLTINTDNNLNPNDNQDINATMLGMGLSVGFSFLPFFNIANILILGDLPLQFTIFTSIIFAIIGAVQVFLLIIIALNLAPKVLGSGFDV
jgi:hypothetical protein